MIPLKDSKDKKSQSSKEMNERKCLKKLLNVFSIFVEQPYLIRKFYKESDCKKYKEFTFYVKGKKKIFQTNEDRTRQLTFFDHFYKVLYFLNSGIQKNV